MNDAELFERVLVRAKQRNLRNSEVAQKLNISTVIFYKYKKEGAHFSPRTRQAVINFLQEAVAPIITEQNIRPVPVFSMEQASKILSSGKFNIDMYSSHGTILFRKTSPLDFSVTVAGNDMMPWYPPGTKLLVGPQRKPKSGDRVVAKVAQSPTLLFKVYVDLGGSFALLSISDANNHAPLFFDKMDKGETWFSVFPIKQSLRDEDALDDAMKAIGKHHFWEDWLDSLNANGKVCKKTENRPRRKTRPSIIK